MRGIHRWSTVSAWGLALFILGVVGYATAAALILAGVLEDLPSGPGRRLGRAARVFNIGVNNDPAARDVLGWWLVPVGSGRRIDPLPGDDARPALDSAFRPTAQADRSLTQVPDTRARILRSR